MCFRWIEVETGFEPVYAALQAAASPLGHSTVEGKWNYCLRADDRARTGDLNLGKVALYQLSYARVPLVLLPPGAPTGSRTPLSTLKEWRPNR